MSSATNVGVGVIGLGMISQPHLKGYEASDDADLVAVCDTDEARADAVASSFGAKSYTEYRALLKDPAVHAVALLLPHQLHYQVAKEALEASKHVSIEKPFTVTEAEAEALMRIAAERGLTLTAAENTRFVAAYVEAQRLVESGALGEIRAIRGFIPDQILNEWAEDPSSWKRQPGGAGAIMDCAPHMMYLLKWLFGEVESLQAFARNYVPEVDLENHAVISGKLASGALFSMEFSSVTEYPRGERVEIFGSDAALIIDQVLDPPAVIYRGETDPRGTPVEGVAYNLAGWKAKSIMAAAHDFVDAIRADRAPSVDVEDAKYTIRLIECAYESVARGGLAVDVGHERTRV